MQPGARYGQQPILVPGRNCWGLPRARRVVFLIDGEAYFSAFAEAVERAQRCVYIIGWDFNYSVRLRRDGCDGDLPDRLGDFLNALVTRRRQLHVYVLDWDFAMIYALDRQLLPVYRFDWSTHRRFHFRLDSRHPLGGSHHQKIVVIDDALAFVGGIDFGGRRWDTPEHRAQDPRRVDPWGELYPPFHDVEVGVDGAVARWLGDLCRERWQRATGQRLSTPSVETDPWPAALIPDLHDVAVAIARTDPAFRGRKEVQEVEALYLDAIAAARRSIFIENQYLTAARVGEALIARLQEPDGPEVVIINPRECSGWLEETTMGVLRARLLRRLRQADRFGRLRVYYPAVPNLGATHVNVHAKLLVVDDVLALAGSANLNNRSMGLDTECNVAVEAGAIDRHRAAIARFRDRILAEHLGVSPEHVAAALTASGSLGHAIESLRGKERSLEPLGGEVPRWLDDLIPVESIVDPERPVAPEALLEMLASTPGEESGHPRRWRLLVLLASLLTLAALWRWTALGQWVDPGALAGWVVPFRRSPLAPLVVTGVYLLASFLVVPVMLLILGTALAFGPVWGCLYSFLGAVTSAAVTYGIGRALGGEMVRRLAGVRLNMLSQRLARHSVLVVAAIRMLPIAPFTVVNLGIGAAHVRFRDFLIGTFAGMAPGIVGITLFAHQLGRAIVDPEGGNLVILAVLTGVFLLVGAVLRRLVRHGAPQQQSSARGSSRA